MDARQSFRKNTYGKLNDAILNIRDVNNLPDIYALALLFDNEDDFRFPRFIFSYNTNEQVDACISTRNCSEREARWSYAFWLRNDLLEIGGKQDEYLTSWFANSKHSFSDEELKKSSEERMNGNWEPGGQLSDKADKFVDEFVDEIISIVQELFKNEVISSVFGRNIPILIIELEYYSKPEGWTTRANPPGLVDKGFYTPWE